MKMNNQLEKTVYMAQLFDYYKSRLTEKQRTYFEYYFFDDYTLQEIADEYGISRAGVLDSLHKTTAILNNLEDGIGMYKQNQAIRKNLNAYKNNELTIEELIKNIETDLI